MADYIICAVTNDLATDQRMIRICTTLAGAGYRVLLVGRERADSVPLEDRAFEQRRLVCRWQSGPRFYYEFNQKLHQLLLAERPDAINACDLDTLWAGGRAAARLGVPLIFDAHEYFTQVPELAGHPAKQAIWRQLGKHYIPKAATCYTVAPALAEVLGEQYGVEFDVIRNLPTSKKLPSTPAKPRRLIYQGVLNRGRCIELYIDSMVDLPAGLELHLYGDGDIAQELRERAVRSPRAADIVFHGRLAPAALAAHTAQAWLGLNLLNAGDSLNYHYSLANKFFDYMQAGIPSLNSPLPEYQRILSNHPAGRCLTPDRLVEGITQLYHDDELYHAMHLAALAAKKVYHWEAEEANLLAIYQAKV